MEIDDLRLRGRGRGKEGPRSRATAKAKAFPVLSCQLAVRGEGDRWAEIGKAKRA